MVRQFRRRARLTPVLVAMALAGLAGCGIKGPLRPAPKAVPAVAPSTLSSPATTSGAPFALPPQSPAPERKP